MWLPATTLSPAEDVILLQEHLSEALAPYVPGYAAEQLGQMARGVAEYCAPYSRQGIPTSALNGQVARALWSVGAHDSAQQWLYEQIAERPVRTTLTALLQLEHVPTWMWRVAADGVVVYHDDWPSGGENGLWAIDVYRINDWSNQLLLAQTMMVRTILKALEPIWQLADGQGTLGVRPASGAGKHDAHWVDFCRTALQVAQRQRGWTHAPHVCRLPAANVHGQATRWDADKENE